MATEHPDALLKSLISFYENYGSEVLGHGNEAPDPETVKMIESFLAGELPETEWEGFFAQIANQPLALTLLAEEIKRRRK